jgi:drug/metabolite transporter (DMT)-like permease
LKFFQRIKLFFDPRQVIILLLLGGVLYAGQSALFFAALRRNSASLTSMLLYVYPAFVALFSWFLYRHSPSGREWAALALASTGVLLTLNPNRVFQNAGGGPIDMLGVAMVILSALSYAIYILSSARFTRQAGPWVSLVWISLGAGVSFTIIGSLTQSFTFEMGVDGFIILFMMVILSTILALGTFLAGIQRVGPTTASLLSALEPVFTVLLAMFFLGEFLTTGQAVGGALVLAAAVLLTTAGSQSSRSDIHG